MSSFPLTTYTKFISSTNNRPSTSKYVVGNILISDLTREPKHAFFVWIADHWSWCLTIPWSLTCQNKQQRDKFCDCDCNWNNEENSRINDEWLSPQLSEKFVIYHCDRSYNVELSSSGVRHITTIVFHNIKNTIGELRQYEQCCASLIQSKDGDWFCSSSCSLIDNTSISNNYHISSVGGACCICIVTKSLQRNALVGHRSCIIGLCEII